jgi:RHS repeat-associated protein
MFTDKLFTGQREITGLGIYHYGARFYTPTLGRFLSADTIVPGYANPQSLNRFSYTLNNPLKYTDPTGHWADPGCGTHDPQCEDLPVPEDDDGREGGGPLVPSVPSGPCSGLNCPIVSSVPYGSVCHPNEISCYLLPELPEPSSGWWPDYAALEVGVPILWIIGVDGVVVVDKYDRVYLGVGPSVGTSPVGGLDVNASLSGGYILDDNTTSEEAHSFISEWSGGGCVGALIGACGVTGDPFGGNLGNPENWSIQVGGFTPQAGVAFPYSWQIYP